jgi:uncharacterized protein (TIGR03083 family)
VRRGATRDGVVDEMLESEQHDFVALAEELTSTQLASASWCDGWSVREVLLHTAAHLHGKQRDERALATRRDGTTDDLIAWLASPIATSRVPSMAYRAVEVKVQLGELLIHHQDVRRPLGLERTIPAERLVTVLEFGTQRLGSLVLSSARKRARGLRLVATDVDWTRGDGPEVRGPAEDILMATSGRAAALVELSGPGLSRLTSSLVGGRSDDERPAHN